MENHTVRSFDKELEQLTEHLLIMGRLTSELIMLVVASLEDHNDAVISDAKKLYKQVNALDVDVDKEATAMLALRQPKANDLRFITSAIKIGTSLERMAELAKNNVKRAQKIDTPIPEPLVSDLKNVAVLVKTMLNQVMKALEAGDTQLAAKVWEGDDNVDKAYKGLLHQLQETMVSHPSLVPSCLQVIFAAKNFERQGDYATRLARNVHYIISGKRPKKLKTEKKAAG